MQFARELRDRVRSGEITCTVRIWQSPRVTAGRAYALSPGYVVVDSIMEISLADVTADLARRSGFRGVVDLLKTAKHGSGERVFYITFHYVDRGPPA